MNFPGRSQRGPDPYGRQVTAGEDRHGTIDTGDNAWPERVALARKCWPQADRRDFERTGKRHYTDKATGVEYVAVRGCVMLDPSAEQYRGITAFLIEDGRIVCLRRPEFEAPLLGPEGRIRAQVITLQTPGPETGIHIL